jgi:hypothetical protein
MDFVFGLAATRTTTLVRIGGPRRQRISKVHGTTSSISLAPAPEGHEIETVKTGSRCDSVVALGDDRDLDPHAADE